MRVYAFFRCGLWYDFLDGFATGLFVLRGGLCDVLFSGLYFLLEFKT